MTRGATSATLAVDWGATPEWQSPLPRAVYAGDTFIGRIRAIAALAPKRLPLLQGFSIGPLVIATQARVALADDADYQRCRKAVIDFLYTRQAHVEKAA